MVDRRHQTMMVRLSVDRLCAGLVLCLLTATLVHAQPVIHGIRTRFSEASTNTVVVAHRGCHNPAPSHSLGAAPENSLQALAHCVSIGADVMETDVHQTADGYLVIMHDDTVDRTTTGRGQVIDLTLAQLRTLRLRQNLGGYNEPPTDQSVLTLDELLEAARGRILLNLDIKAPVYAEVADAVRRAGATDGVFIKNFAGAGSPALAALAPYDQLPFMPILRNPEGGSDLARVAAAQIDHAQPIGFELPRMRRSELSQIALFAKAHRLPLLVNTLGDGFIEGLGGDNNALEHPDYVWGRLLHSGVAIIQTDQPEALLVYLGQSRHKVRDATLDVHN